MDKEIRIIKNHVARFRQIESAADCLFAGLKIGSYVGIALLVWLGVDNWLHLRMEWRIIGFLSVLAGCAPFTIHLIKDLKKTLYQDNLALRLEFHNQHQENWLVNSMDFAKRPSLNPSGIAAELIRLTAANIHQFRLTSRIEWRNVKPVLLPFLSIIGTLVIYVLIAPEYFTNGAARLFFPLGSIPPKTRVVLEGDFESRSVLFGQDHPLRFILKKGRPYLKGRVIFREEDSDVVREEILLPSPEKTYSYVFKSLRNNLHWKVNLGDYQSPWIPLNVILPPKIRSEEIRVRYPSYLSQKEMVDNTWTSVSHFPAGSVLSLQIELTSPIQCLEWVDTLSMQSHEFNKISDSTWQTELKLDRSLSFRLKYTDMDSRSGRFLKEYSFNAILDMPPDVKWNQSEILRLPPSENRFTLISEASDDNGITKAVLKYRRKGDIQWMPLETREINNLRQCTLNWTPDCSKLTSDEEWEFEAVFHDALTENSSPVLRVIWLSELEMRFMLLQNLCSLIRSIRISVTTYLLEGRGTYTKIQWIDLLDEMSRFDSWNSEIKKSGLSPPRLFQAAKTISSIRNLFQSLERSPSKEEMKRTEGELIHAWSDFQTLALSLQSLIVQKEFQNLKKKLLRSKESGCSVSDLLQAAKKGVHLQKILYEQKDYFLNNGEIRMQQHMEPCFQFMDKLSFSSFFPLFLQKIKEGKKTESVSMIGPFLEKWEKEGKILAGFGMKKKSGSLDRDPLLKGVIKKLKTIRGILNRMELSRTVPDEEFKWMKEALKSSLFLCIDELNAIQVQTASTGLHGLTFLNSAGYDLDEMESWYLIGSSLKAESKLKKAIGNITGCLYALEKQIAVSLNRNETAKESKDFKQAQIFIRIIRPIGDLVAPSQGTVEIKALVKSPEGISQVWIHAEPAESHQEEKKIFSSLVEDHPDLPESVSVTARLPISDLKLSVQQTIRVYLSALDSNQNSANSDPFFIRVKKIGDTINLNHYFRFKAMASEVLSLLVESEKDVLRLLEQSEYALIQGKPIQKESWQEMMTMQDLIQEKFLDFISKTETEAEKCSHFPEKDFITFLNLGRSSSVKEFHDVKHALLQIQTVLDEGDFSKEAAISLFFESRNRLQSIVRDLEEMRKFFGLSMNDAVQNNKTAKKWVQAKTFWKKWVQQTKQDMKDGRFGKELVPEMKKRSGDCLSYLKSLELDITPIQEKMTSFLNQLDEPKKADLLEYFSFFAREMERMMGRNLETVLSQTFTDAIIELAENKGDVPSSLQRAENSLAGLSSLGNLSSDKQLALEMLKFSGKQGPIKDVRSITDLLKQSFPVLDERNLGIWERISLNEHKLQLLSPALSDLESVQDFNMKDIQFLEKISSLIDIFSNQIEELKKQAEMNSRPEEKEKQLAQIHILLEKLSGLDRKRKNIEEMIRADAWQFEEDHRIEVEKQVKDLIRFDKEKTGPKELIPRVKEKASLLKEIMKTFLDSRNRDEAMKTAEGPVQSALELFYLFHQLDEKSFERKVPFMTDFLKSILLYKLSVEKQHCRAQDNFLKRIRENARMIDQVCSEFLNELANTAYVEFRRRGEKDLTEKISALGQNIHDARKLLATLQAKMNRTIEDEKEMDRLQKYLVEAKSMLNDLEKERDTVMNLKGITISIVPQEQGKTTLLTKLGLDELEEKAGEMAHLVNEEEEKLDQKILRNLSEELEEMESQREKDGEEREEKLRRIAQTASLMDVPLKGTTAAELKQSLENAVIDGMKQQETTSVAQVLKSLKDAAEFVESGEKETEGGYGKSQKEARFRYLQQFQSQKQQLERIQDFMGEANLLSSHFKSKSDELLSKLDHQMEELRQSMTGEEWLIKQREAREIIQQVTLEFNKETQIRLEGRKPITLDEKKIQRSFPLFIQKDIPGYGLLIRKYLEAVATK